MTACDPFQPVAYGLRTYDDMRITFLALPLVVLLSGCNPIPYHQPCNMPYLRSDLALEPVVEVSTSSYFDDECPIPIAERSQLQRDWCVLHLAWHGSPHRLWMHAESSLGSDLYIAGDGATSTNSNFLGERHTAVKRFEGQRFIDADVSTEFWLTIHESDETVLDRIELTYDTLKCVCADYDSI